MTGWTTSSRLGCTTEHLSLLKEQINKQELVLCISDAVSRSRFRHSSVNNDAGFALYCWVRVNVGQTRSPPIPLTPDTVPDAKGALRN